MTDLPEFDPLFHQPVRTRLSLLLYGKRESFADLKSKLSITDGNLDAHLKKLSAAGFIESEMIIEDVKKRRRPYTKYKLSPSGNKAFKAYLKALERTLKISKK